MSKYFKTIREPVDISAGDETITLWVRELGYLEFQELTQLSGRGLSKEQQGLAIINAICVSAVETDKGEPAFTSKEWMREPKHVVNALIPEVLRVNGMKSDEVKKELTKEEVEGNASPSRRSGKNSASPSAAPSVN